MPETPTPHEGENFVAEQQMTQEQSQATEFREQKLEALGKDGSLHREVRSSGGYTDEYLRGTIKGHQTELLKTSDGNNAVFSASIDKKMLTEANAKLLWERLTPYSDEVEQQQISAARFSLANEDARQSIKEEQQQQDELLKELLGE